MANQIDASPKIRTLADVATNKDTLFRDGFVKGIAEFIKECATPMTIAIQGDWGSGKTSLINLLDAELRAERNSGEDASVESETNESAPAEGELAADTFMEGELVANAFTKGEPIKAEPAKTSSSRMSQYCEDIITVASVDAWQQSVANPRASLLENLFVEMLLKISGITREEAENFAGLVSTVSQIVGSNYSNGKRSDDDSLLGTIFDSIFGSEAASKSESKEDFISSKDIENFQNEFSKALLQAAQKNGKTADSRFVVFVDGLDHVDPEAAIGLMEQVKTYLDCPRCIFIYAIDEQTVRDGVRKKHGDKVDESRKKMFFEKIVQVPLRIPSSVCNLEKYIGGLLKDDKELAGEFARVISTLLKNPSPLNIKRFINTTYLYRNVFGVPEGADGGSLAMLLAATILEIEDAQGLKTVANCAHDGAARFEENLKEAQGSFDHKGQVNWDKLPALWCDGRDANRDAFIAWLEKLQ